MKYPEGNPQDLLAQKIEAAEGNLIKINYASSVFTAAGWRSVAITAMAEQISPGMAKVIAVTEIDGDEPTGYKSRTGAKRQQYNASSIASREIGAKKRISTCKILEVTV